MTSLQTLIRAIGNLLNLLIPILAAAALLVFLWGVAKFIFKLGGSEKATEEGRNAMVWGLIALFVLASVWGIVFFFQRSLNLPGAQRGILPSRSIPFPPITAPQL